MRKGDGACWLSLFIWFSKEQHTFVTFIDLKKAFDTVGHQILIKSSYGVAGKELNWFKSYLLNRLQHCKANRHICSMRSMKYLNVRALSLNVFSYIFVYI